MSIMGALPCTLSRLFTFYKKCPGFLAMKTVNIILSFNTKLHSSFFFENLTKNWGFRNVILNLTRVNLKSFITPGTVLSLSTDCPSKYSHEQI